MPSGKVHAAATIVLSAVVPGVLFYNGYAGLQIMAAGAGCLTGLILTPDLDVNRGSISQVNVNRWGGRLLGLAWDVLWKPYGLIIRHRSFLSHAPIIGTAIRLIYVIGVPWLFWTGLSLVFPGIPAPHQIPAIPTLFWWFAGGLAVSDLAHFVFDQFSRERIHL